MQARSGADRARQPVQGDKERGAVGLRVRILLEAGERRGDLQGEARDQPARRRSRHLEGELPRPRETVGLGVDPAQCSLFGGDGGRL